MPVTTIFYILRAIANGADDIRSYPASRRARKNSEKLEQSALAYEQKALRELILDRQLRVNATDVTNALGYYIHHGSGMIEAHQKYRQLLRTGVYLPGSKAACLRYGRRLRRLYDMETEEDKVILQQEARQNSLLIILGCALLTLICASISVVAILQDDELSGIAGGFTASLILLILTLRRISIFRQGI